MYDDEFEYDDRVEVTNEDNRYYKSIGYIVSEYPNIHGKLQLLIDGRFEDFYPNELKKV